jgi:hypothetical protein
MTTQPAKLPPRVWIPSDCFDENGDPYQEMIMVRPRSKVPLYPNGWYLMMPVSEHEALIAEARAECWRDAAIDSEELAGQMVNDTDKELVLEQKGYFECLAAQYSEARPQSSEPERKA